MKKIKNKIFGAQIAKMCEIWAEFEIFPKVRDPIEKMGKFSGTYAGINPIRVV